MPCSRRVTLAATAASFLTPFAATQGDVSPQPLLHLGELPAPRARLTADFAAARPMIELGLHWLIAHQDEDGRWNADEFAAHDGKVPTDGAGRPTNDVALTGLVLFALAREGKVAGTDPHGLVMQRGAAWLAQQQQDNGLLGERAAHDYIYGHAIGTLGLCATALATGDAKARDAAQAAIDHLEKHRNPYSVWRYQPRDNDNDSSVTTWATLANLAARELELKTNTMALKRVRVWFQQVTDEKGRAGYSKRGEPSSRPAGGAAIRFPPQLSEAMTAAALLCRLSIGETTEAVPLLQASVGLLLDKPPVWQPETGHVDHCYWFFATEALRRADPTDQATWGKHLIEALVKGQRVDGPFGGSWDPVDVWGENGGRIYATAMSVLALQGLYTFPPTKR